MLNSFLITFIVSFINKDNGLFSTPTKEKFSGIIGNNIFRASLSHIASLILLVTSPIIVLGIVTAIGATIIFAFLDGMGGGIGAQIISSLREELPTYIEIYALGTNSIATSAMMKSHANKVATGENAIVVSSKKANIIVAPIAVTIPHFDI